MNKTAVFFIMIVALIAGVFLGVMITDMFVTKLKAAMLLAAASVLIGYMGRIGNHGSFVWNESQRAEIGSNREPYGRIVVA